MEHGEERSREALRQPGTLLQRVPLDRDSERQRAPGYSRSCSSSAYSRRYRGIASPEPNRRSLRRRCQQGSRDHRHFVAEDLLAIALWFVDRTATHRRSIADLGPTDVAAIGLAQMLALFPGVSRSGATLTAGLLRDLRRPDAPGFRLGTPLVTLAGMKASIDLITNGTGGITGVEIADHRRVSGHRVRDHHLPDSLFATVVVHGLCDLPHRGRHHLHRHRALQLR